MAAVTEICDGHHTPDVLPGRSRAAKTGEKKLKNIPFGQARHMGLYQITETQ
jgi:hypothetical protein